MPESCDMFVALPSVTVNNAMILGKNSDRPSSEVQEVIYQPAADHASGDKVQVSLLKKYMTISCKVCSFVSIEKKIDIPQNACMLVH